MPGLLSESVTSYVEEAQRRESAIFTVDHGLATMPARISPCWTLGNNLRIAFFSSGSSTEQQQGEDEARVSVVEVSFEGPDNHTPANRRLSYNSAAEYNLLRGQKHRAFDSLDWWEHVTEYSHNVMKLLSPVKRNSSLLEGDCDQSFKEEEKAGLMKAIWELLEIFYVDQQSLSWLSERLVDWLWHHDKAFTRVSMTTDSKLGDYRTKFLISFPENDSDYWDGIASALAVGWFDKVVELLRIHSSYSQLLECEHSSYSQLLEWETENGLVEAVAVLVSEMPRLRPSLPAGGLGQCFNSKSDFLQALQKWKVKVKKLSNGTFLHECNHQDTVSGLQKLMGIMLGDVNILASVTYNWMELLISQLLYIRPFTKGLEGIVDLAQQCIQLKPSSREQLRELILGIIGGDIEVILAECSQFFDPWMLAHMIDLLTAKSLHARSVLHDKIYTLGGISLQELYGLIYAQSLSSHPFTWQLAPIYLSACENQGLKLLEILFLRQPIIGNDKLTLKVLDSCRFYGLENIAMHVMKIVGINHWKHGRKGAGIQWLQHAADEVRLTCIANQILESVGTSDSDKSFEQWESLIDLLGSAHKSSEGLAFLHKYRDFKNTLKNVEQACNNEQNRERITKDARAAVDSLIQLMKNPSTPKRFWPSLLNDSVRLLMWPGYPLISVSETNLLLCKLQELSFSNGLGKPDSSRDIQSQAFQKLRLALARNLGRAMLRESM